MSALNCAEMPRRAARTIGEVGAVNLLAASGDPGMRSQLAAVKHGAEAATTIACLAIAAANGAGTDDGWPTQAEYAAYWKLNQRRAEREWALVRRAFPGEAGPDRLAKLLVADFSARLRSEGPSAALSLPFPGDVAVAA